MLFNELTFIQMKRINKVYQETGQIFSLQTKVYEQTKVFYHFKRQTLYNHYLIFTSIKINLIIFSNQSIKETL